MGTRLRLGVAGVFLAGCGQVDVSLITYNVAGLPEGISASSPAANSTVIGERLGDYDIVLLQEDFFFHADIAGAATQRYRTPPTAPGEQVVLPSGLSRFSAYPIERLHQERWRECFGVASDGSDCLAQKGFAAGEHVLDLGESSVAIDVYDLHLDSGREPGDHAARAAQVDQLIEAIATRSELKAIIVAGDFNIGDASDTSLDRLRLEAGLLDACAELACSEPERIDRVLYRSSPWVLLEPASWRVPDEFVDEDGDPLSDHEPVAVDFRVQVVPQGEVGGGFSLQSSVFSWRPETGD